MTGVQWFYVSGVAAFLITAYVAGLRALAAERAAPRRAPKASRAKVRSAEAPTPERVKVTRPPQVGRGTTMLLAHRDLLVVVPKCPVVQAPPVRGMFFRADQAAAMLASFELPDSSRRSKLSSVS